MANQFSLTSGSYQGRYMELVCSQKTDIANNRSVISWTLSSKGGSSSYYSTGPTTVMIGGSQVYYKGETSWSTYEFPAAKGSVSGTVTVDHNADGSKSIPVSLSTAIYTGSVSTYSKTWTLDSIPRKATITSAPDFTDQQLPAVTYSNPAGKNVEKLEICIADNRAYYAYVDYVKLEETETGSYTFPAAAVEQLMHKAGRELTVSFVLRTTLGGKYHHDVQYRTFTMTEHEGTKPQVTMTVERDNSSLPEKFAGLCIQGKTRLKAKISAQGKYSATITSLYATLEGKNYDSGAVTDAIQGSDKVTITGYAKDSRGFTGSAPESLEVIPYDKPQVKNLSCYRSDENGNRSGNSKQVFLRATMEYRPVMSGGAQKNFCILQWRHKPATDAWDDTKHEWKPLEVSEVARGDWYKDKYEALLADEEFDLQKAYTVQVWAMDDLGGQDIKTVDVPTQDVALHLGKGGKNVAIGTYCDTSQEYTFHSQWDATFEKSINGLYIRSLYMGEANSFRLQTKFSDWGCNPTGRQTFLVFGSRNGTPVLGVCCVDVTGTLISWNGSDIVTISKEENGVLAFDFGKDIWDVFSVMSPYPFAFA